MELSPSSELATAAADLHGEPDVESTVQSVLHHARVLTGGEGAAVMFRQGHRAAVMSATSPEAEKADLYQIELDEGPSLDVMSVRDAVVVDDVTADERWRSSVCETGFQSVLSLRLGTSRSALGALMERYGFSPEQAFAMLRNSARDHDVKLSERAAQIVVSCAADVG